MSIGMDASFEVLNEGPSVNSASSTFIEDDELELKLQRLKAVQNIDTLEPKSTEVDQLQTRIENSQLDFKNFIDFNSRFIIAFTHYAHASIRDLYARMSLMHLACFIESALLILLLSIFFHGLGTHKSQLATINEENSALREQIKICKSTLTESTETNSVQFEHPKSNNLEELKHQILEYQRERHELIKQIDDLRNPNGINEGTFANVKNHANRYISKAKVAFKQLNPKQLNKKACKEWGICLF
ncbi:hypothetical protein Ciccas_006367 [Cichlidogyrus casuarinus]|uniref:Uncharacterized protein n=1 Tax=Cichlidogyrus casuarinus TaxID=1844966 RepID=A0ABD2Q5Z1_9PLAT